MQVVEYLDEDGSSPFGDWISDLDLRAAARITRAITRMAQGNLSDTKSVGEGVLESRIDFGPGYRVYFGRDGEVLIVLLGGGTKKRQQKDIDDARVCWAAYKRRKRELGRGRTDA